MSGAITDKQVEETLIANRLQLSDAMELARIVYWEVDVATEEFIFNDSFYAFYGTTAEREGGYRMTREEYVKRFIHPDDVWIFAQAGEKRRLNKERYFLNDLEHRIIRRDGAVRYILARVRVNKDAEGRITKYYGANQDITERKLAEEELAIIRNRLSRAEIISHSGNWEFNLESRRVFASDGARKIYGLANAEWTIPEVQEIPLPEYRGMLDRALGDLIAENRPYDVEFKIRRPDTGEIVDIHSVAEYDRHRNIVFGIIQDITERKQAEEALRKSEKQYRRIIETTTEGICVVDQDFNIVFVNKRFAEMLGCRAEEVIGAKLFFFLFEEDIPHVLESRERRIRGVSEQFERRFRRKDGSTLWAHASVSPMMDEENRFLGSFAMFTDITERKRAEEEKQRLESQLLQSQKMEAVGTLAGGVAHDFNNILTVLIGYGTLLRMGLKEDNPLRMYVDQILSSSEKAVQLTQSLLTFSRKQPITLRPVKLNDIIKGTERLLKRLLTEDIALKTNLTPDDTTIMGDATQIDQILFNLATNARDAMPKGGILTVETRRVELDKEFRDVHGYGEPRTYALISISDTGIGMDEATREHIFDPFFTTKEVGKGTGLGLSTVYGIVKQHKGYINVYSEPDMGTAFHIYFPTVTADIEEEKPPSSEIEGGEETILIAEDNEGVRNLMRTILARYGYTIIEAVDGEDAINKFNEHRNIDLMIIDSVMPKKNGREVYDEIRKIAPHIKALFTSGYTKDVILDKGIEEKEFDFISKPLLPNELLRKVRTVLGKQTEDH